MNGISWATIVYLLPNKISMMHAICLDDHKSRFFFFDCLLSMCFHLEIQLKIVNFVVQVDHFFNLIHIFLFFLIISYLVLLVCILSSTCYNINFSFYQFCRVRCTVVMLFSQTMLIACS